MNTINKIFLISMISLTSCLYAKADGDLTVPEKAITTSFIFKCEMVFTPSSPFGYSEKSKEPETHREFIFSWLEDEISKMGSSEAGKLQKQRMKRCLDALKILYSDEFQEDRNMKWEGKHIEEIASDIVTDLRAIASEAGIMLEHDKKNMQKNSQNQQVDPTVKTPVESGNEQGTAGHP